MATIKEKKKWKRNLSHIYKGFEHKNVDFKILIKRKTKSYCVHNKTQHNQIQGDTKETWKGHKAHNGKLQVNEDEQSDDTWKQVCVCVYFYIYIVLGGGAEE